MRFCGVGTAARACMMAVMMRDLMVEGMGVQSLKFKVVGISPKSKVKSQEQGACWMVRVSLRWAVGTLSSPMAALQSHPNCRTQPLDRHSVERRVRHSSPLPHGLGGM